MDNFQFNKLSFDISENLIVLKCDEYKSVNRISFLDFFNKYLNKQVLEINDIDYSYDFLINIINSKESSNYYLFSTSEVNSFYQFEVVKNNDKSISFFVTKLKNVKNFDTYGKIDFLTNIDSRNFFLRKIALDIEEHNFENAAIMMIDLDDFKVINDTFGHAIGDNCLKQVANNLTRILDQDYVGRFGGDEFICFVKDPTKEKMKNIIFQILSIRYVTSDKFENKINLKASIGVSYFNYKDTINLNEQIIHADNALYKAKQSGKNTFAIYGESTKTTKKRNLQIKGVNNARLFKKEIEFRKKLRFITTFVLLFVTILIGYVGIYTYRNRLQTSLDEDTEETMNDISAQISMTIQSRLDAWMNELYISSNVLALDTIEKLDASLSSIRNTVDFDDVGVLIENGELYFSQERDQYNMSNDNMSKAVILQHEEYVGKTYISYSGEKIVFAIPYNSDITSNSVFGENDIVGIVGISTLEHFATLLKSNSYDDNTSVVLTDNYSNKIVVYENEKTVFSDYNNYQNLFDQYDYDKLNENLTNGNSYTFEVKTNVEDYTIFSNTISLKFIGGKVDNNWRIMIIVPTKLINYRIINLSKKMFYIYLTSIVVIILALIWVLRSYNIAKSKNDILSYIDPLTNDINEKRFIIDGNYLLKNYPNKKYALIYLNVLHFKFINETYGIETGDVIIKAIYESVKNRLNETDIVAHSFGDRFLCLLEYYNTSDIDTLVNELNKEIEEKTFNNCLLKLNIIAGAYYIENNKVDLNVAVDKAKLALDSLDREFTSSKVCYFKNEFIDKSYENLILEQNEERAIANHEFKIYYQAKKDIKNDKFSGCEALVRWIDPVKGLLNPGVFIPLFERNGFIIKLDLYVFEQVCIDIRNMIDNKMKPLRVSINLSGKHFLIDDFFTEYEKIIAKYNVPTNLIEFEVTENVFIENADKLLNLIDRIHKIGCTCSLDDFGSGYSSLNMFKDYDFDIIKLDKKFFYGVKGFNDQTKTIIISLVDLAHKLNKKVVAEGIEYQDQVDFLRKIGCDYVQGFIYSKPINLQDYIKLVYSDIK